MKYSIVQEKRRELKALRATLQSILEQVNEAIDEMPQSKEDFEDCEPSEVAQAMEQADDVISEWGDIE